MKIIGIASARESVSAGVGKDAVADRLCNAHGYIRVAIADPMKRFLADVFGFSEEQLWGGRKEAVDTRYGAAWRNDSRWLEAWGELEAEGPGWLDRVGIGFRAMPDLRRWFIGLMGEHNTLPDAAPIYLTARKATQSLGTEFGRTVSPGAWTQFLLSEIDRMRLMIERGQPVRYSPKAGIWLDVRGEAMAPAGIVVPDIRFQDEAKAIWQRGTLFGVMRPGAVKLNGEAAAHASERNKIDPELFRTVIVNGGTVFDLYGEVDRAVENLCADERKAAE